MSNARESRSALVAIRSWCAIEVLYRELTSGALSLRSLASPVTGTARPIQAANAEESSTWGVIKSINGAFEGNGLELTRLERAFETWWPQLKEALDNIPEATEEAPPSRTDRDILEEVLRLSRQMSRQSALNFEFDQETLRNRLAHGLPTEPVDSTEDLDPEDLQPPIDIALRRTELLRRQREREMRELQDRREREREMREMRELQDRREREREMRRHIHERFANAHPSSGSEVPSSNDTEKEA